MKEKLQYLLAVIIFVGTIVIFIFGSGAILEKFGIQSDALQIIFGFLGFVVGYLIIKAIWPKEE